MVIESQTNFDLFQSQSKENLIFIDSAVEDYQSLVSATSPESELIMLDPSRDGILQISEELAKYDDVSSLHIVSHGQAGSVRLGTTELNLDTFNSYADELQGWTNALSDQADILLYGCNVAANKDGQTLIKELGDLTGADIAASDDLTGSNALGGDWEWEIETGAIEASLAFHSEVIQAYDAVLASGHNMVEHQQLLDLVPHDQATHVAINNGSWFNPNTWDNGQVPDEGADVLIPKGRRITYNSQSDARLDTLRVDGRLNFVSGRNTKMLIDTFVVSPDGKLFIGNEKNPIKANKTARIIFTSDKPIDTEWDSQQLSRGLISHGQARIYGADKLDFVALEGDALKGDNELVLDLPDNTSTPAGWQVGDQLVLGGTYYSRKGSDEDNTRFQDEVLTITEINGNRISFTNNDITSGDNTVLRFNHERPEGFESENLELYVANTTRNVIFETENGDAVPTQQRGHVMFMHSSDVEVNNAGFYNLGRSDKNKLVDDPGQNKDGSAGSGTNPRGRYSLHFHRNGAGDINSTPALAKGNAVVGSPGWGIVHHDSHAVLEDNVVFDVVGSGIAAESGNEIGAWRNNLTIKTTGDGEWGIDPDSTFRTKRFDFGFEGEGYWVQGAAQVEMVDNIAISAAGGGINIFSHTEFFNNSQQSKIRDAATFPVANLPPELQYIANGKDEIDVANVPLRRLSGFESYNSIQGIIFWQHLRNNDGQLEFNNSQPKQTHNARSLVDNFKLWNIFHTGVHFRYSNQIDLVDGLIIGQQNLPSSAGISSNEPSQNHLYKDLRIEGFNRGIFVPREGNENDSVAFLGSRLEDSYLANNTYNLSEERSQENSDGSYVFPDHFQIVNTTFEIPTENAAPTAQFNYQAAGGLAVDFDASSSFDSDSPESRKLSSEEIASYGWDFNNDGKIDKFGREADHYFDQAGSHQVTLTVWDSQGAMDTLTKTITVSSTEYPNLIVDGDFSSSDNFESNNELFSSLGAGKGWIARGNWSWDSSIGNGGAAVLSTTNKSGLGQVLLDNGMRRGEQTLSLDLKNLEGDRQSNKITVSVWGVNGEFSAPSWKSSGPQQVGAIPMSKVKLLEQTVGGLTFDWSNFSWDLDFGDGYQFIVFQVSPTRFSPQRGDFFAIDNVTIK